MSGWRKGGESKPNKRDRLDTMARKKEERAVKKAYRQEKKMESYLADDNNFVSFASQMGKMGLQLRDIPGDGNCLFRALGDQLEGGGQNHARHRSDIVRYMLEHREDFEPFVEDDVPFDRHVANLKKQGTYAGNDAIVAFARLHKVNVVIHQLNSPMWTIKGTDAPNAPELHISYHNGDHYSSVRKAGDFSNQPANIKLKTLEQTLEKAKTMTSDNGYYSNGHYSHYDYDYTNSYDYPTYRGPSYNSYNNGVYEESSATMDIHNGYDSDYDNVQAPNENIVPQDEGLARAKRSPEDIISQIVHDTCCVDRELIDCLLRQHDFNVELTVAAIMHLKSTHSRGYEDASSVSSYHTVDSGIWSDSGNRILRAPVSHSNGVPYSTIPNGTAVAIHDEDAMREFEESSKGAKPKQKQLKTRDKKQQKRFEKNKRKEERHKAKVLGEKNTAEDDYSTDEDAVITSQMGMLQI